MIALICLVAAIAFAFMYFTKKGDCTEQACPKQSCPVVKCSLKDNKETIGQAKEAHNKINSLLDQEEYFSNVAEEAAEEGTEEGTEVAAEKAAKEAAEEGTEVAAEEGTEVAAKEAAEKAAEEEEKKRRREESQEIKPLFARYEEEENNPAFKKLLNEFLSLVKQDDFQELWEKRYKNFDTSDHNNDDLKDILKTHQDKFINNDDIKFYNKLITNLNDEKTKVKAVLTKQLFRNRWEENFNLKTLKKELDKLSVEIEKYNAVTGLTLDHLKEISKFNNPDNINKILTFSIINGNLEHFSSIYCEIRLLVNTLVKFLENIEKKYEEKINSDSELSKLKEQAENKGSRERKKMIIMSNILVKLNIFNVSDLKLFNDFAFDLIMNTNITITDFINKKLIYALYLSGFSKTIVESGIYMIFKEKARNEIIEYSNSFNEILHTNLTSEETISTIMLNLPEFIHLFLNKIIMKKTVKFILGTKLTEFLDSRKNISKIFDNYKKSIGQFEKLSEVINIKNIEL